ncbi:hypothetical protein BO85DRAFT_490358 [Aspergillus piperis CBS 112811]|uniref:Uncharacterized protein n=1 Tax=Aspergillus piperis CBS 112811 TaxID=1448313 RepID=A0A8G1VKG3_9EURO|nr:hypothetical protein BO85DRAFT_490358 [Aspergillus piperis CBS 112811]RAH55267.1 hypothetical protein BO85DRAFT_490358 [Aspergillus piperis CBS 112811]
MPATRRQYRVAVLPIMISRRAGAAHLPRELLPSPESWGKRDREASTSAEIVLHTEDVTDIEYRLFRYSY